MQRQNARVTEQFSIKLKIWKQNETGICHVNKVQTDCACIIAHLREFFKKLEFHQSQEALHMDQTVELSYMFEEAGKKLYKRITQLIFN